MTQTPTDRERAREVADPKVGDEILLRAHVVDAPGEEGFLMVRVGTNNSTNRERSTIVETHLSQVVSPSDEVRGLIEEGERLSPMRDLASREVRSLELIEWLEGKIGTAWECSNCGHSTYHVNGYECADCGTEMPLDHMLAFKLHATHSEDNEAIDRLLAAWGHNVVPLAPSRPPEPAASGERPDLSFIKRAEVTVTRPYMLHIIKQDGGTIDVQPTGPVSLGDAKAICDAINAALTRPPEGNARALREALVAVGQILADMQPTANRAQKAIDRISEALALPVPDDEAKRLRDEVIGEVLAQFDVPASYSPWRERDMQEVCEAIRALASPKPPVERQ